MEFGHHHPKTLLPALLTFQSRQMESLLTPLVASALSAKLTSFGTGTINHSPHILNSSTVSTEFPGITLWLDATDSDSITTSGSNINTWANKVDSTVKMYRFAGVTAAPGNDGSINGNTAIKFDASERLQAKKNSSSGDAWNPLGANGSTNGTYTDFAIFLVTNFTNAQWNSGPFTLGWQGHIPGCPCGWLPVLGLSKSWKHKSTGEHQYQSKYILTFYGSTTDNAKEF